MSLVRANQNLLNGGMAVLSRSIVADREGKVVYKARFVCLSSFAATNAKKFVVGSPSPIELPSTMASLRLYRAPTLHDIDIVTENGLTYFDATYLSETVGEIVTTESETLTEFSASRVTDDQIFSISFKYYSKTIEVAASNTYPPEIRASPGSPFDIRGGGVPYRSTSQISRTKTRSSRGGFSFTTRSVGLYVS